MVLVLHNEDKRWYHEPMAPCGIRYLRAGIMTSQYSFGRDHFQFHHRKRSLIQDRARPFRLNTEGLAESFMC